MIIGARLRSLREQKGLTQGEIEKRTGLLRCYICRVEGGHTVPAIPTLEKWARALDVPLYGLFYGQQAEAELPGVEDHSKSGKTVYQMARETSRFLNSLRRVLVRLRDKDRQLLLTMAETMAGEHRRSKGKTKKPSKARKKTQKS